MNRKISRRALLAGGAATGGLLAAGTAVAIGFNSLYRTGEALTLASHRLLLASTGQPLAREFDVDDISPNFPVVGTSMPEVENYQLQLAGGFSEWRLAIDGLVRRPTSLSLAELKLMPVRTQITAHSCERGWTAIAQWTGVQLSYLLNLVEPVATARYVVIYCVDGWYDSYRLDAFEALHPQTILAYGMNGRDMPTAHGAPVRLRVERQLGWKSLKFVNRIQLVDRLDQIGDGKGSFVADEYEFQWYGGI